MRSLQFNKNAAGHLVLSDVDTSELLYPSDFSGTFINVLPEDYLSIEFVSDGVSIYPVNFISEGGLGWISSVVNAVASIGASVIGSRSSKKSNESIERQLQLQQQIELLNAQTIERQAALQQNKNGLSTGEIIGIALAGVTVVGSILYLVSQTGNSKKSVNKKQIEGKPNKQ